jgi:hypothetical protein
MGSPWHDWLRRLRHDLVKRLVWPARDRRDLGGPVAPGELCVDLIDDDGQPATAEAVWAQLRDNAPDSGHPALAAFAAALQAALAAARRDDLDAVLALEAAADRLAADLVPDLAPDLAKENS